MIHLDQIPTKYKVDRRYGCQVNDHVPSGNYIIIEYNSSVTGTLKSMFYYRDLKHALEIILREIDYDDTYIIDYSIPNQLNVSDNCSVHYTIYLYEEI